MVELNGQTCEIDGVHPLPENPVEAMAYIPFQQYETVYSPEKALERGTMFPELDKPFYGKRGASM